jgi:hypothetical protein
MAVRTYAPVGQTPVLRVKLTRDHLSAISGITPDGRLVMQMQDHAYRAEDVVRFLRLSLAQDHGEVVGDLGWLTDPSGQGDQSLPGTRSRQATLIGPAASLRARVEPR